jgi:Flp pilus assembly protein TadG
LDDRGVVAVEFALVLPLLVVLLFTIVLAGGVYFDQLHLQSVARDAARVGSLQPNGACDLARSELSGNAMGTVGCSVVSSCSTGVFKVALTATQDLSLPLVGNRAVTLRASSSFVCPR